MVDIKKSTGSMTNKAKQTGKGMTNKAKDTAKKMKPGS